MKNRWGAWLSGLAFLGVIGLSVLALHRVQWQEDLISDLPAGTPELAAAHDWLAALAGREPLLVAVDASAAADPEKTAMQAADQLTAAMEATGDYARVASGVAGSAGHALLELISQRLPRLLDPADYPRVRQRLAQADARLAALKHQAANPFAIGISDQARQDPLDLAPLVLEKTKILADQTIVLRHGRFFSQEGKHLLILAWPKRPPSDTQASAGLFQRLEAGMAGLRRDHPKVAVHVIGSHRAYLDNAEQIKADVARTSLLALVAILTITLLAMRRPWLAPLALLPSVAGVAAALGMVGLFCREYSLIVVGTAAALLGVLDDYGLHLLHAVECEPQSPLQAGRRIRMPIFIASLTTSGAFATLYFSHFPGQYRLATFSLMAIAAAALFTIFALPRLLPTGSSARRPWVDFEAASLRLEAWRSRHAAAVLLVMLALVVAAGVKLPRLAFQGDPAALNALSASTREAERRYADAFGDPGGRLFIFQKAPDQEQLLQSAERLDAWIRRSRDLIFDSGSLAAMVPSVREQERRATAFRLAFGGGDQILQPLQAAASRQGLRPAFFEPFAQGLRQPAPALAISDLTQVGLGDLLEGRCFHTAQGWVLMTPIKPRPTAAASRLAASLKAEVAGAVLVDRKGLAAGIMRMVQTDLIPVTLLALLFIAGLVFFSTGRMAMSLVVLIPLAAALVLTFGSLAWLGIPVNLINLAAGPLLFGLGADYSLFRMESSLARYRGHAFPAGSVLSASLTTLAGFGALALAGHPALHSVGAAVLLGIFWSLVSSLTITPALLDALLPRETHVPPRSLKTLAGGGLVLIYLVLGMLAYTLCFRPLFWLLGKAGIRVTVPDYLQWVCGLLMHGFPYGRRVFLDCGPERFPRPCIVVANHESQVDIMLILALGFPQRMLVKPWVWQNPITGPLVRGAGFLMTTGDNTAEILEAAKRTLAAGVSLMIFPEGSRSHTGEVQRFRKGAFQLAVETGMPVVPVALVDTRSCVRDNTWVVGPHATVIHPLEAMDSRGFTGEDAALRMAREAKRRIVEAKDRLHPLTCPAWVVRQKIQERFAYLGPATEQTIYWKMKLDPLYPAVAKALPGQGRILDLGCGYGLMGHWAIITGPGRQVVGVDADARKIARAQETVRFQPGLEFHCADIRVFQSAPAEVVLLLDVLHYWSPTQQAALIDHAARLLRPAGRLIFRDACLAKPGAQLASERCSTAIGLNRRYEGLYFRSQEGWVRLFAAAGLRLLSAEACGLGGKNVLMVFSA